LKIEFGTYRFANIKITFVQLPVQIKTRVSTTKEICLKNRINSLFMKYNVIVQHNFVQKCLLRGDYTNYTRY